MNAMGAKDRHLTVQQVTKVLAQQFPSLRTSSIQFLKAGCDSEAFEINGELIFRFPKRAEVQDQLDNELRVLPQLAEVLPVPVPRFEFIGQASQRFPYRFAGYRKLEGTFARFSSLDETKESNLAVDLGEFLSTLHKFPESGLAVPSENGEEAGAWSHAVLSRLENLTEKLGPDRHRACRQLIESTAHRVLPYTGVSCLIHADLLSEHILLSPSGRLAGVIDWGDVQRGDPALDFAGLLHWRGKRFAQLVLGKYGGSKDPMLLARATLFAMSSGLDDIFWGTQENLPEYVNSGEQALEHALSSYPL